MTPAGMVREFHEAFGLPIATSPTWPTSALADLRVTLVTEEARELSEAIASGDRVRIAGEAADLVYVAYGSAWTFGCAEHVERVALTTWFTVSIQGCDLMDLMCDADFMADAVREGALKHVDSALCCLIADAYEAAVRVGVSWVDLDRVIAEVHAANMRKLGPDGKPILRADGKVLKPAGWLPADVSAVLGIEAA